MPVPGGLGDRGARRERETEPRGERLLDEPERIDDHELGPVDHPQRPASCTDERGRVLHERARNVGLRDRRRELGREPLDAGGDEARSLRLVGLGDGPLAASPHCSSHRDDQACGCEPDGPAGDVRVRWSLEQGWRLEQQPPAADPAGRDRGQPGTQPSVPGGDGDQADENREHRLFGRAEHEGRDTQAHRGQADGHGVAHER